MHRVPSDVASIFTKTLRHKRSVFLNLLLFYWFYLYCWNVCFRRNLNHERKIFPSVGWFFVSTICHFGVSMITLFSKSQNVPMDSQFWQFRQKCFAQSPKIFHPKSEKKLWNNSLNQMFPWTRRMQFWKPCWKIVAQRPKKFIYLIFFWKCFSPKMFLWRGRVQLWQPCRIFFQNWNFLVLHR